MEHKLPYHLLLVSAERKLRARSISGYLRDALQNLVAIASDIELLSVLEKAAVTLKALACGVFYRLESQLHGTLEVGIVTLQGSTINPVEAQVCAVCTGPLGWIATVFAHVIEDVLLQLFGQMVLALSHLDEHHAERLRFSHLSVPPVGALRATFHPV